MGVEFFMSIMFPTIFSLGVRGLGTKTKKGSSLIIMAIVGGAVFPVIMGRVSDVSSIQTAYRGPGSLLYCRFIICIEKYRCGKIKTFHGTLIKLYEKILSGT